MLQHSLTDAHAVLFPLGVALGLSVVVERTIELIRNVSSVVRIPRRERDFPNLAAAVAPADALAKLATTDQQHGAEEAKGADLKVQIEKLQADIAATADTTRKVDLEIQLDQARAQLAKLDIDGVWDERVSSATVLVEPATSPDETDSLRAFVILSCASAIGIIAAHYSHVGIFAPLLAAMGHGHIAAGADYALTGLFIGGGSGPAHLVIRFITDRAVPLPREEAVRTSIPAMAAAAAALGTPEPPANFVEAHVTSLPAVSITPAAPSSIAELTLAPVATAAPAAISTAAWTDIPYDGGVDRAILESVHHRSDDPDLIVFHHTAMDSRSTFQDVVRVIKGRTDKKGNHWLTGYHCVVLYDGSIHPFCRWDRYGNHVEGYNNRSLGVTLNGNFETDPSVPDANPNGRFGATRPSAAQLDSAARVVALWCHLYGIATDFDHRIIPHKWIATTKKTCPGSNFPYDEFRRLVTFYRDAWGNSADAQAKIAAFARRPYLFTGSRQAVWA